MAGVARSRGSTPGREVGEDPQVFAPHLTEIACFERGTGFYINPVVPEDAAAILTGDVRWPARSESSSP